MTVRFYDYISGWGLQNTEGITKIGLRIKIFCIVASSDGVSSHSRVCLKKNLAKQRELPIFAKKLTL